LFSGLSIRAVVPPEWNFFDSSTHTTGDHFLFLSRFGSLDVLDGCRACGRVEKTKKIIIIMFIKELVFSLWHLPFPPFSQRLLRIRRATLLRRLERRRTVAGPGRVLIDPKGLSLLFLLRRDNNDVMNDILSTLFFFFTWEKKERSWLNFCTLRQKKKFLFFHFPSGRSWMF
jgi:hypothetical protein